MLTTASSTAQLPLTQITRPSNNLPTFTDQPLLVLAIQGRRLFILFSKITQNLSFILRLLDFNCFAYISAPPSREGRGLEVVEVRRGRGLPLHLCVQVACPYP